MGGAEGGADAGEDVPRADVSVCGGVPEARRKWREIGGRKVKVARKLDESKVAWIVRQKAGGCASRGRGPAPAARTAGRQRGGTGRRQQPAVPGRRARQGPNDARADQARLPGGSTLAPNLCLSKEGFNNPPAARLPTGCDWAVNRGAVHAP